MCVFYLNTVHIHNKHTINIYTLLTISAIKVKHFVYTNIRVVAVQLTHYVLSAVRPSQIALVAVAVDVRMLFQQIRVQNVVRSNRKLKCANTCHDSQTSKD